MRSKPGSYPPFELIPNHGSTHFPTGRDSKPRSTPLGLSQTTGFRMFFIFRGGDDHDVSMRMTVPTPQNTTVIPRIQKPIRPAKTAGLVAHDLFGRDGRGKSFSTLRTAALQDGTPRLRLHSFSEAVFAQALDSTRLICPLHRCGSPLFGYEDMIGDVLNSAIRTLKARAPRIRCLRSLLWPCLFGVFDSRIFSSSDESGRSRKAQELTWEDDELSMHRFPPSLCI